MVQTLSSDDAICFRGRVQGCGLARPGWPGHQNNTVGAGGDFLPSLAIFLAESQLLIGLQEHVRIKDPHDHLFAKGGRHGGQAQFDLAVIGLAGLDATVLGAAFLGHVQATENLQPTGDSHAHVLREFIDVVEHAVDPEPHLGDCAAGLYVDV